MTKRTGRFFLIQYTGYGISQLSEVFVPRTLKGRIRLAQYPPGVEERALPGMVAAPSTWRITALSPTSTAVYKRELQGLQLFLAPTMNFTSSTEGDCPSPRAAAGYVEGMAAVGRFRFISSRYSPVLHALRGGRQPVAITLSPELTSTDQERFTPRQPISGVDMRLVSQDRHEVAQEVGQPPLTDTSHAFPFKSTLGGSL